MLSLKCRKALCVFYSWILFISGVVLICFAVILAYRIFYYYQFIPLNFYCPCVVLCILGIIHLFLTWLGINGPTREHDFHILAFIAITAALFFIEISTGIWAIVLWNKTEDAVSLLMRESLNEYVNHSYNKKVWMRLERELQCCGYNGYNDYNKTEAVPLSCCLADNNSSPTCTIIERGCGDPLIAHIEYLIIELSVTCFSIGLYQIIGIVTFVYFYKFLKIERLSRSTLRRSRLNSLRRQMSHGGVDSASHI
ncbi:hypothetical protein Trydic_g17703 [Trypoxylus dichotomus]